jgi:hypothetical protein
MTLPGGRNQLLDLVPQLVTTDTTSIPFGLFPSLMTLLGESNQLQVLLS